VITIHPVLRPALAVALGAIPGALSRFFVEAYLEPLFPSGLPVPTLIVNVTGCFLMGAIAPLGFARTFTLHPDLRLLLTTGFLGSYTTFSSYELDQTQLVAARNFIGEMLYWLGSTGLGLGALQLGTGLTLWCLDRWENPNATP
jgi:CrcB protein